MTALPPKAHPQALGRRAFIRALPAAVIAPWAWPVHAAWDPARLEAADEADRWLRTDAYLVVHRGRLVRAFGDIARPRNGTRISCCGNGLQGTSKAATPPAGMPHTQPPRGTAARVVKKLLPQVAGARKRAAEFGGRLLCVRYRVDPQSQRRHSTVELVVEEAPTLASVRVGVRIVWAETDLRKRVKGAGGKWDATAALWMQPLGTARQLGLVDRLVTALS